MKRRIYSFIIVIVIVIICTISFYIMKNVDKKESQTEKKTKTIVTMNKNETLDEVKKKYGYNLYRPEQTKKVIGAKKDFIISKTSNEEAIIEDMHEMTHQKVQAEHKQGAIEMTKDHVDVIYDIVKESDFVHKDKLISILTRWKQNDFNKIVDDHNVLWEIQGGKVGKATDQLTTREEKEFIENNFR